MVNARRQQKAVRLERAHHQDESHGALYQSKDGLGIVPVLPGATGDVLTTQADGTWEAETPTPVPDSVVSFKVTTFTSSDTFTTDAKCMFALVRGCAGGGGGGGAESTGAADPVAGGGGGGGGAVEEWFTAAQLGATVSVTIGGAGSAGGGSGSGGNGGNGGDTTFGALFTAAGGLGGTGTGADATAQGPRAGGRGGSGSNGTFFTPGTHGEMSYINSDGFAVGGKGGNSKFGLGGLGGVQDADGSAGTGNGAGGGGGAEDDAGGHAGGAGTAGFVVVVEFLHS